ncbi:MAG: hypothetical protein ACPLXC_01480 [Candidatus Pacearchaeota archaeon]
MIDIPNSGIKMYSIYAKGYKGQDITAEYKQDAYKEILEKDRQRFNELLKGYNKGNKFDLGGFR